MDKRTSPQQELDGPRMPVQGRDMQWRSARARLETVDDAPGNHAELEDLRRVVAVHRPQAVLEALNIVPRRREMHEEREEDRFGRRCLCRRPRPWRGSVGCGRVAGRRVRRCLYSRDDGFGWRVAETDELGQELLDIL
jgi:hypothetical protein